MLKAAVTSLTVLFIAASLTGTVSSGWLLGDTLSPAHPRLTVYSLGALLILLAVIAEGLRLVLAWRAERIWRGSRFQGLAFAAPLWLACTAYCTFLPLLTLTIVPLLPDGSQIFTIAALGWAFLQISAGLLPGIGWSPPAPVNSAADAKRSRAPGEPRPVRVRASAATAEDFLAFLSRLSDLPAGSVLPRNGRIGSNREIVISQAGLAALVGRSRPTVRRWLQELERSERIAKRSVGRDTCILLHPNAQHPRWLPQAHMTNGEAHI